MRKALWEGGYIVFRLHISTPGNRRGLLDRSWLQTGSVAVLICGAMGLDPPQLDASTLTHAWAPASTPNQIYLLARPRRNGAFRPASAITSSPPSTHGPDSVFIPEAISVWLEVDRSHGTLGPDSNFGRIGSVHIPPELFDLGKIQNCTPTNSLAAAPCLRFPSLG